MSSYCFLAPKVDGGQCDNLLETQTQPLRNVYADIAHFLCLSLPV